MKKIYRNLFVFVFVFVVVIVFGNTNYSLAQELNISAQAAVLMDADTGEILYSKNHKEQRPPASTTKVLTAILAIEQGDLEDIVEVSPRASQTGEASLNLLTGEKISLENLLYGALLKSGNDATVAIAEYVAPSVEEFVDLMNLKAKLLGCYNSNFINTNGLPAKNHYSSALDLAIIARYALKNPVFAKIVATPFITLEWENGRKRFIKNTNRLLKIYPGATGVKTGTTDKAGQCLIASATRKNRRLITVVLRSRNRFSDAGKLLNYGFDNFRNIEVVQNNKIATIFVDGQELQVKTGKNLIITLENNKTINITQQLEIKKKLLNNNIYQNQVVGYGVYFNNGQKIGRVPLLAVEDLILTKNKEINFNKIWQLIKGKLYLKAN